LADLTNSSLASSELEIEKVSAENAGYLNQRLRESSPEYLLAPHGRPQENIFQLVAKNRSEPHYIYVGVGVVQNRQTGC
jgi:hypothetical protein